MIRKHRHRLADRRNGERRVGFIDRGLRCGVLASLLVVPVGAQTSGVCDRTPQVRDAITAEAGLTLCADVTAANLAAIASLDLRRQGLTSLSAGDFAGLTGLETLYLSRNSFTSLPVGVFSELTSLEDLWLNEGSLSTLPVGVFSGLTSLGELRLGRNSLPSLSVGVFSGLGNLRRMDLSENRLSSLPVGAFSGLTSLEGLDLERNSLSSLPAGVFSGLASLRSLELNGNRLSALSSSVFSALTSLEYLRLDRNRLSSLQADAFSGLTRLRDVRLDRNSLSSLPAGVFAGLASLGRLSLAGNTLSSLPDGVFAGLPGFGSLKLQSNPGSPFSLELGLERTDNGSTAGEATAVLRLRSGAPLEISIDLNVLGGTLSTPSVTIGAGATESSEFTVNQTGTGPVRVSLGSPPALPAADCGTQYGPDPCLSGFSLEAGSPLDLFEQVQLLLAPASVSENGGTSTVTATVSPPSSTPFTVEVSAAGVAPTASGDFGLSANTTLSFAADATMSTGAVTISATDNAVDALDKKVRVSGSVTGSGVTDPLDATLTITDDETGLCDRTPKVRDAIIAVVGVSACFDATPAQLASVLTLSASAASLTSLQPGDFSDLPNLRDLDLTDNELLSLPAGAFSGLTSLQRLDLSNSAAVGILGEEFGLPYNAFSSLPKGVFAALPNLEELSLESTSLSSVPAGVFEGLTGLQELDLSHNALASLPKGVFAGLTSLERLDLFLNSLSSLPDAAFIDLTNLTRLYLSHNDWSSLPGDSFSGLTELRVLTLGGRARPPLPANLFAGLGKLEFLTVSGSSVPSNLFRGLESLEYLSLGTSASTLPPDVFTGLKNLETLDLRSSSLTSLPGGLFADLSSLQSLYLSNNSLTSLPVDLLESQTDLRLLWLSHNSLSSLPFGLFKGLTSLENLQLAYNGSASFPLVLELEYADVEVSPGEAKARVRLSPGAPFDIGIDLDVTGGTPSVSRVTIPKGATHSAIFTVTQIGSQAASVSLGTPPDLPATLCGPENYEYSCFAGFALETGPPLVLFEELKLVLTRDSIAEKAGVTRVTAKMSEPSPTAFTVDVSASAQWPAVDGDFTLSSNTTLSFAENATESTGTVTITANDNAVPFPGSGVQGEEEKVVVVRGDLSTTEVATPTSVQLEIADDEMPMVTVSLAAERYQLTEGSTVLVTASLSADPKREVVIPLVASRRRGAGAEDYWVPDAVAFGSGQTDVRFPFTALMDSEADSGEEVALYFAESLPSKVAAGPPITLRIGSGGGGSDRGGGGGPPPSGGGDEDDEDDEDDGGGGSDGGSGGGGSGGGSGGPVRAVIAHDAVCADGLCRARTGVPLAFEDTSSGTVRSRSWDFGDGNTSRRKTAQHAWAEPGFYEVTLRVSDGANESTETHLFLVEARDPAGTCAADTETLCLQDSRYTVGVDWWTADGRSGAGSVVREGTNDSGLFWFFDRDNWEVLIKVLNGCALNGNVWVFGASTTDLGYRIKVTDTVTGAVREYTNEPGQRAAAITDGTAFADGCQP